MEQVYTQLVKIVLRQLGYTHSDVIEQLTHQLLFEDFELYENCDVQRPEILTLHKILEDWRCVQDHQ